MGWFWWGEKVHWTYNAGRKRVSFTTTLHSSLSGLWSVALGQFGIISAALTHGAVALPVIMGQRSEATPYPTIHRGGSHTIHNTCTLYPTWCRRPCSKSLGLEQQPRLGKSAREGKSGQEQGQEWGHFRSWFLILTTTTTALGLLLYDEAGQPCFRRLASSNSLTFLCRECRRRMLQEEACKCIWVKDRLNFLDPLEIQMLIFPFPKPKVTANYEAYFWNADHQASWPWSRSMSGWWTQALEPW